MKYKILDEYHHHHHPSDGKCRVLLLFFVKDIINDIRDHAYLGGDAAKDEGIDVKVADHYIDIADEKNKALIQRSIGLGISECEQKMLFLIKDCLTNNLSLDSFSQEERPEYAIELRVAVGKSRSIIDGLHRSVLDYVTARILRDYCLDAYPAAAERWGAQMDQDIAKIETQARLLDTPVRRKPWPIW